MSLKDMLIEYLQNEAKHLQEIYGHFSDQKPHSIRARLNENINTSFKRITNGVYLAIEGETKALIIEGNSWEVIKEFEDNSIDTIITDPPYTSLDHNYKIGKGTSRRKKLMNKNIGYETRDLDQEMLFHINRVTKKGGHIFIFAPSNSNSTLKHNMDLIQKAQEEGLVFNKEFIWNKVLMGMGYNGRSTYEAIFFFSKGKRHIPYDFSIKDVLTHKMIHHSKKLHTSQKPIELIEDLMKFSCKKGDVCLDLFGGSMSTSFAGLRQGVHTICVEACKEVINKSIEVEQ